tara:strand:- start:376 stop:1119 length:744 start_codon:yes stop_codon:yes gene_type:complete
MLISENDIYGSIGGGQLEYSVIEISKKNLSNDEFNNEIVNIPLGPSIGQCCGGYVRVSIEKFKDGLTSLEKEKSKSINLQHLYIFGAGHIGQELSSRSIDLDFKINLVDSRIDFLNLQQKDNVNTILANSPWLLIKNLPKNSFFIILTHSHDYDFKIINEILRTQNFKFLGLIGSKTKFNRFKNRLLKIGHKENLISKIECPVGLKNISSKKPAEIAISIIGRLLEYRSQIENYKNHDKDILKKINE